MTMKKKMAVTVCLVFVIVIVVVIAFSVYKSSEEYRRDKAASAAKWDCSVTSAEKTSNDEYVITYSDVEVLCKTGTLSIQNRNDFDIFVHLLCQNEEEYVSGRIPVGGNFSFLNVMDKKYTVGVHADVEDNTEIKVFVFDGKNTEPYLK